MNIRLPTSRGKPFHSKLEPFAELIRDLRRRRNTYQEIRDKLREEHGITASRSTIFSFVKVRSKRRKFYTMTEGVAPVSPTQARHTLDPIEALRRKPLPEPKKKIFEFDETKPLTLIKT
jgi:hypothetical protein